MTKAKESFSTIAVHAGNGTDKETGAIKRPIVVGNSYALPYDPSGLNWSDASTPIYTRNGGANQHYLESKLAKLSQGEDAVVLASGVAALSAIFFTFLKTGDHIVSSNVTYIAVYRLLNQLLPEKYQIQTTLVDSTQTENIEQAIQQNTKLIHIESPSNPTLGISDISAIAQIAGRHGILLSVDNTFASPYHQLPLKLGADLVVESLTKYINGHGDALGGAVIGNKKLLDQIRLDAQVNQGGIISPFNAWLIQRGSVTLPLRMAQHAKSALKIALWLEKQDAVSFVSYPGLKSHPGHAVARQQMIRGYSGMIAFGIKGSADDHNRFISYLQIITSAVSLGHDESLIVFLGPKDERIALYPPRFHQGFFRFSVGLEESGDLIRDIRDALKKTFPG